jgi:hypothetical protein
MAGYNPTLRMGGGGNTMKKAPWTIVETSQLFLWYFFRMPPQPLRPKFHRPLFSVSVDIGIVFLAERQPKNV